MRLPPPRLPDDRAAREALARDPDAPAEALAALLVEFPEAVLENPVLPLLILEGRWSWEGLEPWAQARALESPNCPPGLARWSAEQLRRGAGSAHHRAYLAGKLLDHPDLPVAERRQLLLDHFAGINPRPGRVRALWPELADALAALEGGPPPATPALLRWLAGLCPTLAARARAHPAWR